MNKKIYLLTAILSILVLSVGFPQVREEREERQLKVRDYQGKEALPFKLKASALASVGYDNNALLSTDRKGDIFEEFLVSIDFLKPFSNDLNFRFDYDFDIINYNEVTAVSNTLNHFRTELNKKFSLCQLGVGYDLGLVQYLQSDNDFAFHKGFVYMERELFENITSRLQFESGSKDYSDNPALDHNIGVYQDKDRLDRRLSAESITIAKMNPKLYVSLRTKFSKNDSNALYVDFYDYSSMKNGLGISYMLFDDLYLTTILSYTRKEYDSRTVTLETDEQKDNLYEATAKFKKRINKNNAVNLAYTYRENSSNDELEEYSESVISCGWQYSF